MSTCYLHLIIIFCIPYRRPMPPHRSRITTTEREILELKNNDADEVGKFQKVQVNNVKGMKNCNVHFLATVSWVSCCLPLRILKHCLRYSVPPFDDCFELPMI